ncbi:MAG: ABC transporter ATP-binding protein [Dorea sp.]|nr:ABC transporter ATP-binding protein [Dorea sp.]
MELKIEHITKQYKDKLAVDDVSLTITPGIWGLLGANGAGKTTLMRMIAGIMEPTSGRIVYDGVPIATLKESYRDIFGYLPQEFGFYPEFTVKDYLEYVAVLKGLGRKDAGRKIEELLERLSLADVRKKRIAKLSGGMKRRVGIAQALLNDPEILILDEPTSGLDPGERIRFRNLLSEFAHDRIVVISTHIVSDVEYIASQNAVMKDGKIIQIGSTESLVQAVVGKVWQCHVPAHDVGKYERSMQVVNLKNEPDGTIALRYLSEQKMTKDSLTAKPRLEDLYLWLFPQEREEKDEDF